MANTPPAQRKPKKKANPPKAKKDITQVLRVDNASLEKYSLALLLVVGFSLDQPDDVRRHALAVLR